MHLSKWPLIDTLIPAAVGHALCRLCIYTILNRLPDKAHTSITGALAVVSPCCSASSWVERRVACCTSSLPLGCMRGGGGPGLALGGAGSGTGSSEAAPGL